MSQPIPPALLMLSDVGSWLPAILIGYLLGSIPFGLLLARAAGHGDIRRIGSGNIGATNVLRTGDKKLAAATLLLDGLKGAVAVIIADRAFGGDAGLLAGLAAFLGHLFPVWLNFKGGKGVATYIGVVSALAWQVGVVFCLVWFAVALVSRLSSLAALVASVAAPLAALAMGNMPVAATAALMSAIIFVKHSANIRRLMAGEEPKIGAKAQ
jgi:glycerol-3-phosphate acyltransferase PlsY